MISTLCKATAMAVFCDQEPASLTQVEERFSNHLVSFGLSYGTVEEYNYRLAIFAANDAKINAMNQKQTSFQTSHNQFSTLNSEEQERRFGRPQRPISDLDRDTEVFDTTNLTGSVDWRTMGAVNPVQDQGQCGSCWAFSSVAAMEGVHQIKSGNLLKLSEQQFVDCDKTSSGCNGGLEVWAFAYAKKNAIETESDYPYTAKNGRCSSTASKGVVKALSYATVTPRSAPQLLAAIAIAPTCVSVNAGDSQFMFYSSGILSTNTCGTNLDHAITAVGYGSENGQNYFIVRNSWGSSWGESGYIRMSSDVGGAGVCGVLLDSTTVQTD